MKELALTASSNANLIEYGVNYYGDDNFGRIFPKRIEDKIPISLLDIVHDLYGKEDVFVHTHQGPGILPGLSVEEGDIDLANQLSVAIMAIDISNPNNKVYYCYNPNSEKPVL